MRMLNEKRGVFERKEFFIGLFVLVLFWALVFLIYYFPGESNLGIGRNILTGNFIKGLTGKAVGVMATDPNTHFIFQIETEENNQNFTFQIDNAVNLFVDWGDGNSGTFSGTKLISHKYGTKGVYNISLKGTASRIAFGEYFSGVPQGTPKLLKDILTNVSNGVSGINSSRRMFYGCTNITSFKEPAFFDEVSRNVTDMYQMFYKARNFNGDISSWNTSKVTDMSGMFDGASYFNQPLDSWNTSSVTSMSSMFGGASSFNQPLNSWNISKVTNMYGMFYNAQKFNQSLNDWDVSKVTNMNYMFNSASSFNQPLNSWNTSNVKRMDWMFACASSFNQSLNSWNTSKVEDMWGMFVGDYEMGGVPSPPKESDCGSIFNQPLDRWNVSNVKRMDWMFYKATSFNQPIGNWNTSKLTKIFNMFDGATSFNQDISSWDVSNVESFYSVFSYAVSFNQDISSWNVSNVSNMKYLFYNASSFNQPLNSWNTSKVTDMSFMFYNASKFNQPLNSWDVSKVTSMANMLSSSNLSVDNYGSTLNGWAGQSVKSNVPLGAHGLNYSYTGKVGRDILTGTKGWNITGDNLNCVSNITNTSWSAWRNLSCSGGKMNQSQNKTEYDKNNCGTFQNKTHYNSRLVGPTYKNSSWSSWSDLECLPTNYMNQSRTLISSDIYGCSENIVYTQYRDNVKPCDYFEGNYFIFQIETETSNQNFTFQVDNAVNLFIDWGDGDYGTFSMTGLVNHTYLTKGVYNVSLNGIASRIAFGGTTGTTPTRLKDILTNVSNGVSGINSSRRMFYGCTSIASFSEPAFFDKVSGNVTDMYQMFYGASSFDGNISSWNTSKVTDMSGMFDGASYFNQPLDNWNVSNVSTMDSMLNNTNLSVDNYDATLNGWANQNVQSRVKLGADGLKYSSSGEVGRNKLIGEFNWNITGDSLVESSSNQGNIPDTQDNTQKPTKTNPPQPAFVTTEFTYGSSFYLTSLDLRVGDKITFYTSNWVLHSLELKSISSGKASFILKNDSVSFNLGAGEEMNFDLDKDSKEDFYIKLLSVNSSVARVSVQALRGSLPTDSDGGIVVEGEMDDEDEIDYFKRNVVLYSLVSILVLLDFVVIFYMIYILFGKED